MEVVERGSIPIYEVECFECRSKIRYKKCEVPLHRLTCPVCGVTIEAHALLFVDKEAPHDS